MQKVFNICLIVYCFGSLRVIGWKCEKRALLMERKRILKAVTKKGTIVIDMGTKAESKNLSSVLFGKTRRAILSLLFTHTEEAFYLREIVNAVGAGLGAAQREVEQLSRVGIIKRMVRGRHVYFQANTECPIFEEIKSLIIKTAGAADVLKAAFAPLADRIKIAFIYGSFAKGDEHQSSDLDILVVGDITFAEVSSVLSQAQEKLGREINPAVFPPDEFQSKLKSSDHFLKTVLAGKKIFFIGDESELARLGKKRLAG